MEFLRKYQSWAWLLLLIPIYFFIFWRLDGFQIRLWDESYYAVHVTEMLRQNSWMVQYFNGEPVNWGTKPLLQTWIQMIFIQVLGNGELALRLPSAIAAAVTVLISFHYARNRFGELSAWITALVLLTSVGFITFHTGRGAESDALLALLMFLQVVFFARYITEQQGSDLIVFGVLIALAFLAKSIAGFLFVPGVALYLILLDRELLGKMLRSWQLYVAVFLAVGVPVVYIYVRETLHPGMIDFMLDRQVSRLSDSIDFTTTRWHYVNNLITWSNLMWSTITLAGIYIAFRLKVAASKEARLIAVVAVSYFLIITISSTRHVHYLNPFYPLIAILSGLLFGYLMEGRPRKDVVILTALLFVAPFYHMYKRTKGSVGDAGSASVEMSAKYLCEAIKRGENLEGLKVMYEGFNAALVYYQLVLEEKGQKIYITNWGIEPGDRVLNCVPHYQRDLQKRFVVDTLDQHKNAFVVQIVEKRRRSEAVAEGPVTNQVEIP